MNRLLVTLCCCFCIQFCCQSAVAESRKDLESRLEEQAELNLPETGTITIQELLEQIQQKHGIQVRLDRAMSKLMIAALYAEAQAEELIQEIVDSSQENSSSPSSVLHTTPYYQPPQINSYPTNTYLQPVTPAPNPQPIPVSTPYEVVPVESSPVPVDQATNSPSPVTIDQPAKIDPTKPGEQKASEEIPAPPENEPKDSIENVASTEKETFPSRPIKLGAYEDIFHRCEIPTDRFDQSMSVEQVLRTAIDQIGTIFDAEEEFSGLPASYTHAYDWDLTVSDDAVIITTQLQANLTKYVQVYKIPENCDCEAEEFADIIKATVRPYSWEDRIDDVIDMVEIDIPEGLQLPDYSNSIIEYVKASGIPVEVTEKTDPAEQEDKQNDEPASGKNNEASAAWGSMKAMGSLFSSGSKAFAHSMVSAIQQFHHADPPSATIKVLPSMLVIRQSRGAHQEIDDLLQQIIQVNN